MDMPGFFADRSLDKTSAAYCRTDFFYAADHEFAVTPAKGPLRRALICFKACVTCDASGGRGPSCWMCRDCMLTGDW